MAPPSPLPSSEPVRLDIWLDVACLCRTRSEAQAAIKGGKVDLNGHTAKPHKEVKPGDVIELTRPLGRRQRVQVVATTEKHIPKAEARALYTDITPPPTPEEQAMLDLLRLARPGRRGPASAPTRNERRRLRREKEGEPD
jgi:ribosome-associated heat shock protein Hsp15